MRYLFIFDDGHGIETVGKRTPNFADGTFMRENDFSSIVVDKMYNLLKGEESVDVVFTASEKRDVSLDERCERANEFYEDGLKVYDKIILISVHANAFNGIWGSQNGMETFYYPTNEVDKKLAETINSSLSKNISLKNRGNSGGNFQILRDVKMSACLVECAFMDNLKEAELLKTDEFRQACAKGIVDGLKEYVGLNKPIVVPSKVEYSKSVNDTYQLKGDVKDFGIKVVDKANTSIVEPNCVNGSFFWRDAKYVTYPTSILFAHGKVYRSDANHLPYPQSVFIVDKNNYVAMKQIKTIHELDLTNLRLVIGGVGLVNKLDTTFKYNPSGEGFIGAFTDVLQKRNKTVIGYIKKEHKIVLMCRPNIYHSNSKEYDLLELVNDCEFDIAISLDGGGSTFMNNQTDMVFDGDGRRIHNIVGFNL